MSNELNEPNNVLTVQLNSTVQDLIGQRIASCEEFSRDCDGKVVMSAIRKHSTTGTHFPTSACPTARRARHPHAILSDPRRDAVSRL